MGGEVPCGTLREEFGKGVFVRGDGFGGHADRERGNGSGIEHGYRKSVSEAMAGLGGYYLRGTRLAEGMALWSIDGAVV